MIGIAIRDGPRHPWAGRQLERIGASVGPDVPDGQLIADTGIAVRDGPRHQRAGRGPPENERPGQLLDVIQVKATGTPASPSNETSKRAGRAEACKAKAGRVGVPFKKGSKRS